jgi:hypothetical protein
LIEHEFYEWTDDRYRLSYLINTNGINLLFWILSSATYNLDCLSSLLTMRVTDEGYHRNVPHIHVHTKLDIYVFIDTIIGVFHHFQQ